MAFRSRRSSSFASCILVEHNFNLLCTLVTGGNLSPVKKLIQKVCQEQEAIVTLETFSRCSHMYNQRTPLVLAAQFDHIEIVEYLTDVIPQEEFVNIVGSVYNITNTGDELHHVTALNAACIKGYLSIAKLLVERKASFSIPDCTGSVPLCEAVFHGQYDIVKYLCEQGNDVHVSNDFGWEPLHIAALRNHPKVFKCLIEQNASVDRCTPEGFTALHIAAQKGHTQIIDQLILASNVKPALSSWFHGKVLVPSPLNLASAYSCGSSRKIIETFLDLPQCSPTHRCDAYLLIGVSCIIKSNQRKAFFHFQEAIKIIEEHSLYLPNTQNVDVGRREIRDSNELVEMCGQQNPRSDIEMWYQALLIWERCIGLGDMTYLEILSEIAELSMRHEREVLLLTGIRTINQTLLPKLSNGYILPEFFEELYDTWVINNFFFKSTRSVHESTLTFSKFLPYMLKSAKTISSQFTALSSKYGCKRRSPLKLLTTIIKVFDLWLKSSPSTGVESACFEMGVQFVEEFLLLNDENTILHYILEENLVRDLATMEFLLQCGCSRALNMRCKGLMCLHVACVSYNMDAIGLLLNNGAHIDAADEQGRTPLYIVQEQHSEKVSEFISRFCSSPLPLECLSATAVLNYDLFYDFLPLSVCQFVALHSAV
ncbi:protein fem-1 homolog C-like [Halichondria panicea]|uniref:protein fem-1 homolog C-like n=1 Tax=Halichondria panicea TaxID=6063 RepID=UPI00312B53DE